MARDLHPRGSECGAIPVEFSTSAMGQQRRFRDVRVMSDLPQTADVRLLARHGSDGAIEDTTGLRQSVPAGGKLGANCTSVCRLGAAVELSFSRRLDQAQFAFWGLGRRWRQLPRLKICENVRADL